MKKFTKKVLSILLAVLMIFSVVAVGAVSASGVTPDTLYVVPNANWKKDGARFAAYFFNGDGTASTNDIWVSAENAETDGVYQIAVPEGGWVNVIFCRMNPNNQENNWNTKWNQTPDLDIPTDGTDCYTVKENTWDNGGGAWSTYDTDNETEETESKETESSSETESTPVENKVALMGTLSNWDNGAEMTEVDGVYTTTVELEEGTYEFKVKVNDVWLGNSGEILDTTTTTSEIGWEFSEGEQANCKLNATGGTYTFNFDAETNMVIVLWTPGETESKETDPSSETESSETESTPVENKVALMGTLSNWDNGAEMTEVDGVYTTTVELEEGTYEFKVKVNDVWLGNSGEILDTTTTTSEIGWEFSEGEQSNCKLNATGGTYTFNFNTETNMLIVLWTPAETESKETEPSSETESSETEKKTYTLVGFINGANVGCEEDAETVVEAYNFVNGEVTINFEKESYVFVKTTDNMAWYMFDGYCDKNSGTMYNTGSYTPSAYFDKMYVPVGEVTFTLTDNGDGTLNLSYVIKETESSESGSSSETDSSETTPSSETEKPAHAVRLAGDFNDWLGEEMKSEDGVVYTTTIEFAQGVYVFKIAEDDIWLGNEGAIEDTTEITSPGLGWELTPWAYSNGTLIATGGTYTFNFNTETNMLIVLWTPEETESSERPSATGTTSGGMMGKTYIVNTGNYDNLIVKEYDLIHDDHKLIRTIDCVFDEDNICEVDICYESDFNIYNGSELLFTSSFNAIKFRYISTKTFGVYDTLEEAVNAQPVETEPTESQPSSESESTEPSSQEPESSETQPTTQDEQAKLAGSFNDWELQPMVAEKNTNVVRKYVLPAGKYSFKMVDSGLWYGSGSEIDNTTTDLQLDIAKDNCVLNAVGGEYTFIFNVETRKLTIEYAECDVVTSNGIDGAVTLAGDFNNWEKEPVFMEDDEVVVIRKQLEKGSYKFKFVEKGLWYGSGSEFTDTTSDLLLDATTGDSVLNASGGEYTFRYNKVTHKLTIDYKKCDVKTETLGYPSQVTISGDLNGWAQAQMFEEGAQIVRKTVELPKGSYLFKVVYQKFWYGSDGNIENQADGVQLGFTLSDCILKAEGGRYTFEFDLVTKKLNVLYEECEVLVESDVKLSGEFNNWRREPMMVADDYKVKTKMELPKGKYQFKVVHNGFWYGSASTFTNTATDLQLGFTSSECILDAEGGMYTFIYDVVENTLTVECDRYDVKVESDVALSGQFNGWSKDAMYVESEDVVSLNVTLDAGKYQFKIVEDGLWYGSASEFKDTTTDLQLNCTYSECIIDSTGGTYKISFNTKTKTMSVTTVQ